MFLPDSFKNLEAERIKKAEQKEAYYQIEAWAMEIIPDKLRGDVMMSVQEVECNDPDCSPIDTAIAIIFSKGGRGMLGLPMQAKDVKKPILIESFPTPEVLTKWSNGEEAEWPPFDDEMEDDDMLDDFDLPPLRFAVGTRVECRIGPDPVTGWAKGEIIKHWYREEGWPEDSYAPYRVQLDNGQGMFAPGDVDQIIRAETL